MLLEIVAPEGVTLPRSVEAVAARIIRTNPSGRKVVKDRTPGALPTVTFQLHQRLEFGEWCMLSAVLGAGVTQAGEAIAKMPALPEVSDAD